jgi:hypothetical protein
MAAGEPIVSQAQTEAGREGYARTFGDTKPQRGKWVMTPDGLVPVEDYTPEPLAVNAPIIADRLHENQAFDDGERVWDIGTRRRRREMQRETGLADAGDFGPGWSERKHAEKDRHYDRRTHEAFDQAARKLYNQGRLPK